MSDTVDFIKDEIRKLRAQGWSDSKIRDYLVRWQEIIQDDNAEAHPCVFIPGGCYPEDIDRAFSELGGRRLMTDTTKKVLIIGGLATGAVLLLRSKAAREPFRPLYGYGPSTETRLKRTRRRVLGGNCNPGDYFEVKATGFRHAEEIAKKKCPGRRFAIGKSRGVWFVEVR